MCSLQARDGGLAAGAGGAAADAGAARCGAPGCDAAHGHQPAQGECSMRTSPGMRCVISRCFRELKSQRRRQCLRVPDLCFVSQGASSCVGVRLKISGSVFLKLFVELLLCAYCTRCTWARRSDCRRHAACWSSCAPSTPPRRAASSTLPRCVLLGSVSGDLRPQTRA